MFSHTYGTNLAHTRAPSFENDAYFDFVADMNKEANTVIADANYWLIRVCVLVIGPNSQGL